MKFKLKRKNKQLSPLSGEEARMIFREEIELAIENQKKLDDEEKEKILRQKRFESLPARTKLKMLRYMKKQKGEKK